MATHELRGGMPPAPRGVVLVIHGGGSHGWREMSWKTPAVMRMWPFAASITRAVGDRLAVIRLKNRYFGWNGEDKTPLLDAHWALDQIRARYAGLPIALIGHSMGGRVILNMAGEPDVKALAALAPWVAMRDQMPIHAGQKVLLMHGTDDRMTYPHKSADLASILQDKGIDTTWRSVEGGNHSMLKRARDWHREVTNFTTGALLE